MVTVAWDAWLQFFLRGIIAQSTNATPTSWHRMRDRHVATRTHGWMTQAAASWVRSSSGAITRWDLRNPLSAAQTYRILPPLIEVAIPSTDDPVDRLLRAASLSTLPVSTQRGRLGEVSPPGKAGARPSRVGYGMSNIQPADMTAASVSQTCPQIETHPGNTSG